jgi:hypothetical protein
MVVTLMVVDLTHPALWAPLRGGDLATIFVVEGDREITFSVG